MASAKPSALGISLSALSKPAPKGEHVRTKGKPRVAMATLCSPTERSNESMHDRIAGDVVFSY